MKIHPKTRIPPPLSRNHRTITIYLSPRENTVQTHVWIAQVVPSVHLVRPFLPSLTLFFYFQGVFWQESPSQGKLGNSVVTLFVMLSHLALCKGLITRKGGIGQLIINSTLQKKHFCNKALSGRSSIKGVAGSVSMSGICICQNRLCMLSAQTFHICFCLFPCQHPKAQKSCVNCSVTYRLLMCSP